MFMVEASPLSSSSGQNPHQPVTSAHQNREPVKVRRSPLHRRQDGHPLRRALPPASPHTSSTPQFSSPFDGCSSSMSNMARSRARPPMDTSSNEILHLEPTRTRSAQAASPPRASSQTASVFPPRCTGRRGRPRLALHLARRPVGANPQRGRHGATRHGPTERRARHRTTLAEAMRRGPHARATHYGVLTNERLATRPASRRHRRIAAVVGRAPTDGRRCARGRRRANTRHAHAR